MIISIITLVITNRTTIERCVTHERSITTKVMMMMMTTTTTTMMMMVVTMTTTMTTMMIWKERRDDDGLVSVIHKLDGCVPLFAQRWTTHGAPLKGSSKTPRTLRMEIHSTPSPGLKLYLHRRHHRPWKSYRVSRINQLHLDDFIYLSYYSINSTCN